MPINIGRIDYLNIWHVFHLLERACPEGPEFHYLPGHPSALNHALASGMVDISPSSSFEYLTRAGQYHMLRGASICAHAEVQSVLFLSPAPLEQLPAWLEAYPGPICVTSASATSTALLNVLWNQKWKFSPPDWQTVPPGSGLETGRPFLEIGNLALKHFVHPPAGYHILDLAREWTTWTGLPFVFAVWIVRRGLPPSTLRLLERLREHIDTITAGLEQEFACLATQPELPAWLNRTALLQYWQAMNYELGPKEQAGLTLFAKFCTMQGLLPGAPGLTWA